LELIERFFSWRLVVVLWVLVSFPACSKKAERPLPIPVNVPPPTQSTEIEPVGPVVDEEIRPEEEEQIKIEDLAPPIVVEPEPELPGDFDVAEERFNLKDYPVAVEFYESYLSEFPDTENAETACFRIAVSHCLPASSLYSVDGCRDLLNQLVQKYPESVHSISAALLLKHYSDLDRLRTDSAALKRKVSELTEELEKLKSIDLQRRKDLPPRRR